MSPPTFAVHITQWLQTRGLKDKSGRSRESRSLPGARQALAFQFPADLPRCLSHSPPRPLCGLPELDFIKHTARSFSLEALECAGLELRRHVWLEIVTERGSDSDLLLDPSSPSTQPFQHPTHFSSSPAPSVCHHSLLPQMEPSVPCKSLKTTVSGAFSLILRLEVLQKKKKKIS